MVGRQGNQMERVRGVGSFRVGATPDVACHNCGARGMRIFYALDGVPVHSCLLMSTREEALRYPRADIRLGLCEACGFIENVIFDPALLDYSSSYEETQGFSARFNAFARELAQSLVDRYNIHGQQLLEIGCGKGEFLGLMCEIGDNRGIGIDPAYVKGRLSPEAEARTTFITDFYSDKYAQLAANFVCCRHTLEHIQDTRDLLTQIRNSIGERRDTIVFFEVPDVTRVLREIAFWDIYNEHCSYFSLGSLARLFRSCDFDVLRLSKGFEDQYLLIDARPGASQAATPGELEDDLEDLIKDVAYFQANYPLKLEQWRTDLTGYLNRGSKPVLWGSGSKAVAYLNSLRIRDEIEYVVDINPFKHGKYLAGTGHLIVPPEFLKEYRPDTVIVMNPVYVPEITQTLNELGLKAEVVSLQ